MTDRSTYRRTASIKADPEDNMGPSVDHDADVTGRTVIRLHRLKKGLESGFLQEERIIQIKE